ncbi:translocation/assembly module TamB domain-containing protein [Methylocystis sp. MJC1]|jgi:translocation and assembly module TamB|uniref:translocation/assembly module TamB domain-containing protein n=1 Tax=Methylocystis sp. MJC1 TaxID=2654282 RepID=UPI0013E9D1F7|nr:translocation/assembly module TamB domain-containing protein [Methylocystis sp. MJC1]KAF2989630.1 Translocation and assembly module TamB [Methylocystis sp. MJC1]MBU6525662.1 translocation/assembly module TamB domain-containing protein [Methylocystis sp. MJC1]UZX12135.1 translocation/assembly module TamB domain-containing protein [Methylocystis sp. MJC1]
MRKPSRGLVIVGGIAAFVILAAGASVYSINSASGGRSLARVISEAASTPDMKVEIGAIDGVLSPTPAVRDIVVSDRDGPWLRIDRVAAKWSPLAALGMKLDIDRIDVGEIDVLRAPVAEKKKAEQKNGNGSFPPKLPIGVRVGELALAKLILAEPVLDAAATLSVHAGAELTGAAAGIWVNVLRLDAPGSAGVDAVYAGDKLRVKFAASEPGDGLIARRAKIPGLPPVEASVAGEGPLDAFAAKISAKAGKAGVDGEVHVTREGAARRFDLALAGRLADLLPQDLAAIFADVTKVEATSHLADNGAKTLDRFALAASAFKVDGAGRMSADGKAVGKVNLSVAALDPFSRIAGRQLHGVLDLSADIAGAPLDGVLEASLDGAVTSLGSGVAAVDGLAGGRVRLTGKVATLPGGGFAFDRLALAGEHLSALVDGKASKEKAAIEAKLDLPELRYAGLPLSGRANVAASVTGSLEKPDATLLATLEDATANGRPIPQLALQGEAHDLLGRLAAAAKLDGVVDRKPARGRFSLARTDAGWTLDDVDLAIGGATAKGALAIDGAGLANGRLRLAAPNLDDLSALALQKLGGRLEADISLDAPNGEQSVSIDAEGAGIEAAGAAVGRFAATLSARDLLRKPALEGEVSVDNARFGKEAIGKARLLARPAGDGAAMLDLTLDARGFNVASRATLTPGETTRLDIAQFSAQRAGKKIALAQPAAVTLQHGAVALRGLALSLGSGRLDIDGVAGESLDIAAKARAVPLSIASMIDPTIGLDGLLDAEARITGTKAAPAGEWRVKLAKISAPQLRANGLPAVDVAANGRLANKRTTVDADVAVGPSSKLKITGSAPLGEGALDLAVKGALDAALANTMLAANGQTAAGKANVDLRLTGPAASPIIGGSVVIADAAFNDPLNGVSLAKISGRIEGRGRDLTIDGLTAQTKNGGRIAVAGKVTVAPDAGMPGSIRIGANNAQLAATDIVSSTGDLDLTISGALARNPKISGKVNLDSMDVSIPDRLPANLKPLPGSTHIDAKGFAAQMLALEKKQQEKASRKSGFDAALDLALSAPNKIFVRGRGIDAEFGGDLKISGTIQKPNAQGGFELRRGKMQLLTQRIDLTRGKLTFAGGLTPALDFEAETTASDITAKIDVTGPAASPSFAFSSTPELPQDEVLSRLLFAKASGSLTPFQAVQLAAALAQLSGAGAGVDAFEKMRKALGVDSLDLDAGGGKGPTVGASRYIANGVSVGVKTGANPQQTSVNVGVDVTRGLRLQSETGMSGATSLGVGIEHEY